MTDATVSKNKFGATVYKVALERTATEEGKAELKGFSVEQFLGTLKRLTETIDDLPPEYSIGVLYLSLNYIGSLVVHTMELNKKALMAADTGKAQ